MYPFKEAVNAKRWSRSMGVETNYAFQQKWIGIYCHHYQFGVVER